jgi:hypothetical protein
MAVIGLRGGGAAKRFARAGWRVLVVEPDAVAVRTAERHLHFSAGEVPVTVSDPRVWARRDTARFAAVVLDAFDAGFVPCHLVTREFFHDLRPRLAAGGLLAVALPAAGWADPAVTGLAATMRTAFANVLVLPTSEPPDTPGAIVLLASDRALDLPDERLPQPSDHLMNLEEHWGVVEMTHAWFNRFEPAAAAPFTDDRNPVELWSDRALRATRAELHDSFRGPARSW